jgi:alkylhydroperoxidase family enzyme
MRLEPVEKPRGLLLKLAYWISRRRFGKVPANMTVLYGNAPNLAWAGYQLVRTLESRLTLDHELVLLVMTLSSQMNGCSFCADLHLAQAVQEQLGLEKFRALGEFQTNPVFSERERAALAYCEEVTRERKAGDETFAGLHKHFDAQQIVELTWLNALGNFFNLIAIPLGVENDGLMQLALERRTA